MNPERLLAHFETISEAPDAIARLRRFILDLAVRGKLVELPKSWLECTLGHLGDWGSGGTPLKTNSEYYGGDIPWLVIGDLNDGLVTAAATSITEAGLANSSARIVDEGTLLVAMYGSIGKLGVAGMRCATNQAIAFCRPYPDMVTGEYLFLLLKSLRNELLAKGQGVAQQNISQKILKAHAVELPPIDEQPRIVAKVGELMALCDQLEAARQERQQSRERLVAATLQRLNQPAEDPASFRRDARFAMEVLPSLASTAAQIKQLRQTILNLAVRGKLVEQDPEDEPAEGLRNIFKAEKIWLAKTGQIKTPKRLYELPLGEYPLVPGWVWERLGCLSTVITKGSTPTSYGHAFTDAGINFIKVESIKNGVLLPSTIKSFISSDTHDFLSRSCLCAGDVLFSIAGSIGTCAIVEENILPANTNQALAIIRGTQMVFSPVFLLAVLRSSIAQPVLLKARGVAMNNVSLDDIRNLVVPLPPLAEQHRIVAKVDTLMALCDELEQQLSQADQQRRRLLEAVLAEALREPEKALASLGSA